MARSKVGAIAKGPSLNPADNGWLDAAIPSGRVWQYGGTVMAVGRGNLEA